MIEYQLAMATNGKPHPDFFLPNRMVKSGMICPWIHIISCSYKIIMIVSIVSSYQLLLT